MEISGGGHEVIRVRKDGDGGNEGGDVASAMDAVWAVLDKADAVLVWVILVMAIVLAFKNLSRKKNPFQRIN